MKAPRGVLIYQILSRICAKTMSITGYLKEIRAELGRITWPTRKQAVWFTILVIVISVVLAYMLGFFDFLFSRGLETILAK